jgi:hypothetical protein
VRSSVCRRFLLHAPRGGSGDDRAWGLQAPTHIGEHRLSPGFYLDLRALIRSNADTIFSLVGSRRAGGFSERRVALGDTPGVAASFLRGPCTAI